MAKERTMNIKDIFNTLDETDNILQNKPVWKTALKGLAVAFLGFPIVMIDGGYLLGNFIGSVGNVYSWFSRFDIPSVHGIVAASGAVIGTVWGSIRKIKTSELRSEVRKQLKKLCNEADYLNICRVNGIDWEQTLMNATVSSSEIPNPEYEIATNSKVPSTIVADVCAFVPRNKEGEILSSQVSVVADKRAYIGDDEVYRLMECSKKTEKDILDKVQMYEDISITLPDHQSYVKTRTKKR